MREESSTESDASAVVGNDCNLKLNLNIKNWVLKYFDNSLLI